MATLLCCIWLIATLITLWGSVLAMLKFKFTETVTRPRQRPITILKPIKGITSNFEANIESFFQLKFFPGDQIIFCVENNNDSALPIIHKLMRKYPKVKCLISTTSRPVGVNPKINNIYHSYEHSINDLVLISDDNAIAPTDYLDRLDAEFTNGILTAVITCQNVKSIGGELEAMMMGTFYSRGLLLAHWAKHPCVMGKSMMFRKSEMGVKTVQAAGKFLAEDYAMGLMARAMGFDVKLMSIPVKQNLGEYPFHQFWDRHIRWGRLRKYQAPWAFIFEPLFYSFISAGLIGTLGFGMISVQTIPAFFMIHLYLWMFAEVLLLNAIGYELSFRAIGVWLLRELTYLPMWFKIAIGNQITWKGRQFKIIPGGKILALAVGSVK
jgi:ceramide glucosyltransferase